MNVLELRNYLLKPGTRDQFISYFKRHFIESQSALGAYIPCIFRVKDEDDRFFWIRGFNNMQERSKFLPGFYGGEVWKEFGPAANDMMLEWHNVYLVKPQTSSFFPYTGKEGVWVIDFYIAHNKQLNSLFDLFAKEYITLLNKWNINNITLCVSETEENDFPRLPVYQDKDLFAVITNYKSEQEYKSSLRRFTTSHKEIADRIKELTKDKSTLILYPAWY